jgi:hypothetical protein
MTVQPRPSGRPPGGAIAVATSGLAHFPSREPALISRPWIRVADARHVADPESVSGDVSEISARYRHAA